MRGGASWFFWIAGVSIINLILQLAGNDLNFVVGLGITQVATYLLKDLELTGKIIAIGATAAVTGLIVFFGLKARSRKKQAFITGMVIYAIDALFFFLAPDYLSIAFHGIALFFIVRELIALDKLNAALAAVPEQTAG